MPFYTTTRFRPSRSIGYLCKRVGKLAHGMIEARFADHDISFSQWIAMAQISSGVLDTAGDVARDLGHDSGATTRLIDLLESRGLILRTRDPKDRRVVRLSMTPEGTAATEATTPRVMAFWNEALSEFDDEEAEQLLGLMQRLYHKLETMDAAGGSSHE